jgi:hypothetical protein
LEFYRLYIDEVGNHDLKHVENPNLRFLSLTGIMIESEYLRQVIKPEINKIKETFFESDPDEPVIFHRKEIINKRGPYRVLWNEDIEKRFNDCLLKALKKWEYKVITAVIDKKEHKDKYHIWRYHPYHYCLTVILERFAIFLNSENAKGDIMVESRGTKEDKKLCSCYKQLYNNGTDFVDNETFQKRFTSKELKVKPKWKNITGLQIADLIAYPSQKEILIENKIIKKRMTSFGDKICEILRSRKYLRNKKTGQLKGYGKKLLP